MNEYVLCDILCALDYAKWVVCIMCIVYIIRKDNDGQDRDITDC
jgi:hypothetical protein